MNEELIDNKRNYSMANSFNPFEEKINVEKIKSLSSTEVLNQPIKDEEYTITKLPENTNSYDRSIKIILLGNSNVGKSSIVLRLGNDPYNNYQGQTISLQNYNYFIKINNYTIRMQIWDTAGQEKFDSITSNYYNNTDVAIFVYAINDKKSFDKIEKWDIQLNDKNNNTSIKKDDNIDEKDNNKDDNNEKKDELDENLNLNMELEEINKNIIKVLIGNKKDLENERQVTYEEGKQLSETKKFDIFKEISTSLEISEKGDNYIDEITDLFNTIGKKIYNNVMKKNLARQDSSCYCYQASNTILLEGENDREKKEVESKSCCC